MNSAQLNFDFSAPVVVQQPALPDKSKQPLPRHIETQKHCCDGTEYEKPMQQFIDWYVDRKQITGRCYQYIKPIAAKTWGFFEAYFSSSGQTEYGQPIISIDDKIPKYIAEGLGLLHLTD